MLNVMNINPRHINEVESDRRGVKDGWYSVDATGKLGRGPFSNREDCATHIKRQQAAIDVYRDWMAH
jgi:hypothetical protein